MHRDMIARVPKGTLRAVLTLLQRGRRLIWRFVGTPRGVHALAYTSQKRLVLVKLSYAKGWRAPGGGKKKGETSEQAILRELREEIGLQRYRDIKEMGASHLQPSDRSVGDLFVLRDVEYAPRPSFEIEAVQDFSLVELPRDISPRVRRWIHASVRWLRPDGADEAPARPFER